MTSKLLQNRLSLREVADSLEVDISSVGRWCRGGVNGRRLRSFMLGGRRFVLRSDLDEFLGGNVPDVRNQEPG